MHKENPSSFRFWIAAILLLTASVSLHALSRSEVSIARDPLSKLPYQFASWKGEERPLPEKVVHAISVSDYTDRVYLNSEGDSVLLYIGFYDSQRTGSTIHSPKNCLPGAGWDPIRSGYVSIPMDGKTVSINEYVIQRDRDKLMVFYWYQGRGRVIAGEYSGKFWMVADAISRNRTDGALIRVMTPMKDGESEAQSRLVSFTQLLVPYLNQFIPK
jgi:EpsI family protein